MSDNQKLKRRNSNESNYCLLNDDNSNLLNNQSIANNIIYNNNSNKNLNQIEFVSFSNGIYENNCFINITIHYIYHCEELKNYLLKYETISSTPKLITELITLLNTYEGIYEKKKNKSSLIQINDFKNQLAIYFQNTKKFQMNRQDDPIELLTFLFEAIHAIHIDPIS